MRIIHKFGDHIVHRSQDNGILFTALEFVNGRHFPFLSQLGLDGCYLVAVWGNDADLVVSLRFQPGKHFFPHHVNLALVQMSPGMIAWGCFVYGQDIGFSVILSHNN